MNRCKRCKRVLSLFSPKIPLELVISKITLVNSLIAQDCVANYSELCLTCVKDVLKQIHSEIFSQYQNRLKETICETN